MLPMLFDHKKLGAGENYQLEVLAQVHCVRHDV